MVFGIKRIGTLLPMSSLVSRSATQGTFEAGEVFLDWLAKSGQTAWQVLPLHETQLQKGSKTKHVPSPYKGYGIGLDPKYLGNHPPVPSDAEIKTFIKNNKYWIHGYALFCALRDHFGTDDWSKWPREIRVRNKPAVNYWEKKLAPQIRMHLILQVQLHLAYQSLQAKAHKNKILLIGDMPFYLGLNGPLVWEYQHLFDIESSGKLKRVSGVLKGAKSHFGRQVWGHPLYKWQNKEMVSELSQLFKTRVRYLASLYNYVRFDHAKGLFEYGVIDLIDHKHDAYQIGPGRPMLEKILKIARSKKLKIYAEDTGDKLKDLRNCLHIHHIPGVKIFRFAYNEKRRVFIDQYLKVSSYPKNTVAYTTTHDTEPLMGYLEKLSSVELSGLKKKLRLDQSLTNKNLAMVIRDKVIRSPAKIVLIPLQDWLLTTDRINTPGTEREKNDPNWGYVMTTAIEDLPVKLF